MSATVREKQDGISRKTELVERQQESETNNTEEGKERREKWRQKTPASGKKFLGGVE